MSLLDGPDTVTVYPDEWTTDGDGNRIRRPSATGQPVRGRWQYDTAREDNSAGQDVSTTAHFLSRGWPTGFAGRVTYDGRDWDVDGDPTIHGQGSPAVQHVRVELRARKARAVA